MSPLLILGLMFAAMAVLAFVALFEWVDDHDGWPRVLLRFAVGLPLSGEARTDARWFTWGKTVVSEHGSQGAGRVSRWAYAPFIVRGLVRWGVLLTLALGTYLALVYPSRLKVVALLAAIPCTAAVVVAVVRYVRTYRHRKVYVQPLHDTLAPKCGVPMVQRPEAWLTVPRNRNDEENPVRVELPRGFDLSDSKTTSELVRVIVSKTQMEEHVVKTNTVGRPVLMVQPTTPPPPRVHLGDVRELLPEASENAPLLGLARKGRPVFFDLEHDSPHLGLSAGTGGGKSTLIRGVLAQGLHNGGVALIIDFKATSLGWARHLPNTVYVRHIEDIHEALLSVGVEIARRGDLAVDLEDEFGNVDTSLLGPRIWLVAEELNATTRKLQAYWKKIKEKEDPPISPAVEALQDALFLGRASRMNVIASGQRLSAGTLGSAGGDARENFACRALTRYTTKTWRMLAEEVWPPPPASKVPGRWQIVSGGTATETQVAEWSNQEAKEYALAGAVSKLYLDGPDEPLRIEAAEPVERPEVPAQRPSIRLASSEYVTESDNPVMRVTDLHPGGVVADVTPVDADSTQQNVTDSDGGRPRLQLVEGQGQGESGEDSTDDRSDERVTLAEAYDRGIGASVNALRMARKQDPEFPEQVGSRGREYLYSERALRRWSRNRARVSAK